MDKESKPFQDSEKKKILLDLLMFQMINIGEPKHKDQNKTSILELILTECQNH